MTDLTRKKDFAQKKSACVAAARLTHDMVSDTALQELFNLPPNALITNSYAHVEVAGQTSLTVDFGFDGGAELGNDLDIDDVGPVAGAVTGPATSLATDTGKTVTAKFSAAPTAGSFVFIVEFIEYDLSTGELMNYSA